MKQCLGCLSSVLKWFNVKVAHPPALTSYLAGLEKILPKTVDRGALIPSQIFSAEADYWGRRFTMVHLEAIALLTIACFTGWRSHAVVALLSKDVVVGNNKLQLSCSVFKNVGDRGLPSSIVAFPKLPLVWQLLRKFCMFRLAQNEEYLFS